MDYNWLRNFVNRWNAVEDVLKADLEGPPSAPKKDAEPLQWTLMLYEFYYNPKIKYKQNLITKNVCDMYLFYQDEEITQ